MKQKISLPIKAMSINSFYYGNKNHGKTAEAREWTEIVCQELSKKENKEKLKLLREHFDHNKHVYKLILQFKTPKFRTKDGKISVQSLDLSNIEKHLIDILFIPKFYGSGHYECENLNIDDKYIVALYSSKEHSSDYSVDITIKICKAY